MQAVRVDQVTKRFDTTTAVAGVSLEIRPGELFTLLGPSGCGKTTLLRLLAGLEESSGGAIYFGEQRVDSLPAHKRNIGMVFQNYAVFPHMSVADNVAYGLRARKLSEPQVQERVGEALALVRMADYGARRPDQLSGGQQQRVALARALATRPALLLMDEPLSNLDAKLRQTMREEIRRLQKQVGITTVYVTHDQEEALAISDRIGVMEGGRLLQVGTPLEIYSHPAHQAVAGFVGTCSFLPVKLDRGTVRVAGRTFTVRHGAQFSGDAIMAIRPEQLHPLPPGWDPPEQVALPGRIVSETFLGAFASLQVELAGGETVTALSLKPPGSFPPGAKLVLAFRPADPVFYQETTGEAIR